MCGVEILLCLACGAGVGGIAAWKARGAMTHKGKVVVDQQGRVMGKDGKLLRDKKGNYVYIDKNKKQVRGPAAASGETHRKIAKEPKKVVKKESVSASTRLPLSKRNAASPPPKAQAGQWGPSEMAAWSSHVAGKENSRAVKAH